MKKTLILLVALDLLSFGCATDTRVADESITRQYLGIALPKGAVFTPIVLKSSKEQTIAASVIYIDGRRDIQVLEDRGHGWQPLGRSGRGITGVDGTFLQSAIIGRNGRIWVLAGYSYPSNPDRGNNHYLYVYDGSDWQLAGPQNGAPSGSIGERGLGFLGDYLAHMYLGYDSEKKRDKPYLKYLEQGKWKTAGAEQFLRSTPGQTLWTGSNLWHLVCTNTEDRTVVDAYIVDGIGTRNISGPHRLLESPGTNYYLNSFDVSHKGDVAVLLADKDSDEPTKWLPYVLHHKSGSRWTAPSLLPPPPVKYSTDWFGWSPACDLMLLHTPSFHTAVILAYRDGKWMTIAEGQQTGVGQIFDPSVTFSEDGLPIVTWEDFIPCGGDL